MFLYVHTPQILLWDLNIMVSKKTHLLQYSNKTPSFFIQEIPSSTLGYGPVNSFKNKIIFPSLQSLCCKMVTSAAICCKSPMALKFYLSCTPRQGRIN